MGLFGVFADEGGEYFVGFGIGMNPIYKIKRPIFALDCFIKVCLEIPDGIAVLG
jgi:hypothetical protein